MKNIRNPLILIIYTLLVLNCVINAEEYNLVKIYINNQQDVTTLQQKGIDLEGGKYKEGIYIETILNNKQILDVEAEGYQIETIIHDLVKHYQNRFDTDLAKEFDLGSMGGYYTFTEVVEKLDEMYSQYPNLITQKHNIGTSYEGRTIWAVKISDNPNSFESGEPEVLYTGLHHAREPESMMVLIYFMFHLLENYGNNDEATHLVNNRQLWFIPVVNPDGYVYNQTIEPNGGGMHRKNRYPNSCSGTGVGIDLNRNYGYFWGYDNTGSSDYECDETYRGTSAFSEMETQVVRDFCNNHNFNSALNYHTYSNLLIHPFGYEAEAYPPEQDLETFREYLHTMSGWNGYTVGTCYEVLGYMTNGDANDWMYGELGIFACTPEVGNSIDGFWPATNRILPLAEENLLPNLFWAWMGGTYLEMSDYELICSDYPDPGEDMETILTLKNKGLENSNGTVTLNLSCESQYLNIETSSINFNTIPARTTVSNSTDPIQMSLGSATPVGKKIVINLEISDQGGLTYLDSIVFRAGTPTTILNEDAENTLSMWNTGSGWGLTNDCYSGEFGLTDSPTGNYPPDCDNLLSMNTGMNFNELSSAMLTYWTKWDIESGWDFGQVEISIDGGNIWTPLRASQMNAGSGSGVQETDEYGYEGFQNEWIEESIILDDFIGNEDVRLGFALRSDSGVEEDGWYLDNISVMCYPEVNYTPGDVNYDGNIDVLDIVRIVNIIMGNGPSPTPDEITASDLNGDNDITVNDIVMTIGLILMN